MSKTIKEYRFILVEVGENSNKYWNGFLYDDGSAESVYGRVGVTEQRTRYPSHDILEKKAREKLKKGYTPVKTIATDTTQVKTVDNGNLAHLARQQIKVSNPNLTRLVDRLLKSNIHKITSSTTISYNAVTGIFSTPLGVVTPEGITEARSLLADIKRSIASEPALKPLVSRYLRIVPHDVGMKLNVRVLFPDDNAVQKESDILDSLESSYQALHTAPKTSSTSTVADEQVFNVALNELASSDAEYRRIERWYESSKKSMHSYDRVKIVGAYVVDIEEMTKGYDTKLGNDTEVWHGTSEANLLSILKSGLRVSPPSTAYIAGKMFGNGIYGSQTSSKSLGYTFGRWGGSTSSSGWLFVCDFAMGNAYYPTTYGFSGLPKGYDSCWALPKNTGLHNDELIVYKNNHVKIKYLLEVK